MSDRPDQEEKKPRKQIQRLASSILDHLAQNLPPEARTHFRATLSQSRAQRSGRSSHRPSGSSHSSGPRGCGSTRPRGRSVSFSADLSGCRSVDFGCGCGPVCISNRSANLDSEAVPFSPSPVRAGNSPSRSVARRSRPYLRAGVVRPAIKKFNHNHLPGFQDPATGRVVTPDSGAYPPPLFPPSFFASGGASRPSATVTSGQTIGSSPGRASSSPPPLASRSPSASPVRAPTRAPGTPRVSPARSVASAPVRAPPSQPASPPPRPPSRRGEAPLVETIYLEPARDPLEEPLGTLPTTPAAARGPRSRSPVEASLPEPGVPNTVQLGFVSRLAPQFSSEIAELRKNSDYSCSCVEGKRNCTCSEAWLEIHLRVRYHLTDPTRFVPGKARAES